MSNDVTLPALGESVTEGTVTRWLKAVGDTVAADEPLLEVSTDKVDTEIPSPFAGVLLEILVPEDEEAEVGAILARIGEAGEAGEAPAAAPAPEAAAPAPEAAPEPAPAPEAAPAPAAAPAGGGRDVTLPALGESVTEGTVTRWLKAVGDSVDADEPLLEVSTDKVDTEIPSPFAGVLTEIVVAEDEIAEVGSVLARIGEPGSAPAPAAAPEAAAPAPAPAAPAPAAPAPAAPAPAAPAAAPSAPAVVASSGSGYVTPIVRKLASDKGVDLSTVTGTGVGGRIRKEDVLAAATAAPAAPAPAAAAAPAPAASSANEVEVSELRGQTVKMTRIRKITADKMMESLHGMAQLTSVVEVDCTKIWALRARNKAAFSEKHGVNLTFLPFFTRAVAIALQEHAFLNASVVDDSIVYHPAVNLSLAVDTPKGLMLPTLKDADAKTIADHAKGIVDLAGKARSGGLSSDEISGGTFSVTNTGSGGTLFDTPIVPSPQVGILATCAIVKKPVVVKGPDGEDVISVRPMAYLPLSYDHRIVDGADAARFLQTVKRIIEAGEFESELGL
ncbi:2-oxoglutarate dehydrogenase E2 component [Demequina mangrovi]|uniref:Dihydrolipoamide acetyltransferase component of pyruvate dehydrogenase complex n=3 Tax=Demequina mangrovi TaxID=1043493 RepID=A0A1H6UQY1_9MICO|nr:2-oxoglutarate dehydrogenase, E2 component, dihydrolipoamide succinyltransferase [Demequina mangrovi]SEI90670.1 2-oxoglutarate dehydrogenase E2 component [Demequina mangrovi]